MTIKDLLGCYVETMHKDTVRIYVCKRVGNNELVYQDHICNLKEEYEDLEVFHWFASALKNEETDTEITIFVKEDDYKALNIEKEDVLFGDDSAVVIRFVDTADTIREIYPDSLGKFSSIIDFLRKRGRL